MRSRLGSSSLSTDQGDEVKRSFMVVAGAIALAACAPTINLLNPTSPRFDGAFAPSRVVQPYSPPTPIRVVSFNIKLADHIDSAIAVLGSDPLRAADIISLQEMDESGTERIARALKLNYIYYPGSIHPTRERYFGPAILSRWPIEKTWKLTLPYEAPIRRQRRNATAAVVNVAGTRIWVYAVHLETQLRASDYTRQQQAAAILADAAQASGPVVVAGDFNSWWIGKYFERQGFVWPTKKVGKTISLFSWDHIFVRGIARTSLATAGKVREVRGASDHRPVWASVILSRDSRVASRGSGPATENLHQLP
jgi:endonuclease/exonuclease/phosphatase family metal-dependent hydrolase